MCITIKTLRIDELDRIASLWEGLRLRHLALSTNFKAHFERMTFADRCKKFRMMPPDCVRIIVAEDANGVVAGYCVCSVQNGEGELDSIFVKEEYREQRLGYRLAEEGVDWLKAKGCGHIDVTVAEGNEEVFPFYEKLGFQVRATVLRLKQQ